MVVLTGTGADRELDQPFIIPDSWLDRPKLRKALSGIERWPPEIIDGVAMEPDDTGFDDV